MTEKKTFMVCLDRGRGRRSKVEQSRFITKLTDFQPTPILPFTPPPSPLHPNMPLFSFNNYLAQVELINLQTMYMVHNYDLKKGDNALKVPNRNRCKITRSFIICCNFMSFSSTHASHMDFSIFHYIIFTVII